MQPDEQLFDLPAVPEGSLYVSVAVPAAVPGLFTYSVPKDSNKRRIIIYILSLRNINKISKATPCR